MFLYSHQPEVSISVSSLHSRALSHSPSPSTPFLLTPRNSLFTSLPLMVSPTLGHNCLFSLTHMSSHTLTPTGPHYHMLMPVFIHSQAYTLSTSPSHADTHMHRHPWPSTYSHWHTFTSAHSLSQPPHVHSQTSQTHKLSLFYTYMWACYFALLNAFLSFFRFLGEGVCVCSACGILVPQPRIELMPAALETRSLNHWSSREVPL